MPIFKNKQHKARYIQKMTKISNLKQYKERLNKGMQANIKEIISNLNRMLVKGMITEQEYRAKMTAR